jgi:lipoprotein signal peptidase
MSKGVAFGAVAIIQTILHYLGLLGIVLGIVALIFSNTDRGVELLIGGVGFIVTKYVIGFIFVLLTRSHSKGE